LQSLPTNILSLYGLPSLLRPGFDLLLVGLIYQCTLHFCLRSITHQLILCLGKVLLAKLSQLALLIEHSTVHFLPILHLQCSIANFFTSLVKFNLNKFPSMQKEASSQNRSFSQLGDAQPARAVLPCRPAGPVVPVAHISDLHSKRDRQHSPVPASSFQAPWRWPRGRRWASQPIRKASAW